MLDLYWLTKKKPKKTIRKASKRKLTKRMKMQRLNRICPPHLNKKSCKKLKKCTFGPLPSEGSGRRGSPICHIKKLKKISKANKKRKKTSAKQAKKHRGGASYPSSQEQLENELSSILASYPSSQEQLDNLLEEELSKMTEEQKTALKYDVDQSRNLNPYNKHQAKSIIDGNGWASLEMVNVILFLLLILSRRNYRVERQVQS